jgi:protein disulfide-isomerase A6
VVKVGAVNADEHQSLGGQYGIQGFPTIKVFGLDKSKPTDYQGIFLTEFQGATSC